MSLFKNKNSDRWRRRKLRHQNPRLKKKFFGHLIFAPCCYCKFVFLLDILTIEHLTPLVLGGANDRKNLALACAPCNQRKGREAWMQLKNERKENKTYEQYSTQHNGENREVPL
jgi:5-methylcytosine-specific restriction endonuclease McrA